MRIVTGQYGGRTLVAPKSAATRPMTEKMRAALFDSLGNVQGAMVIDAYAGSGAVGIEALSRGAGQVIAIESARSALAAIAANIAALQISWGYSLESMTVESWLARYQVADAQPFDLIVADPPYQQLKTDVLEKLGMLLQQDGVLAVSHSVRLPAPLLEGLSQPTTKSYGDSSLSVYRVTRR